MNEEDLPIQEKILLAVIREDEPMSVSDIKEKLDESRQRISYQVNNLVEDSLILETEEGQYIAQPPFYDNDLFDEFIANMEPIFDRFIEHGFTHKESTKDQMVKGNVKVFVDLIGHLTQEMEVPSKEQESERPQPKKINIATQE